MGQSDVLGLTLGILCSVCALGVGVSEAGPNPVAPRPVVERSLADLEAFHAADVEDALQQWSRSTDPLHPFYEPPPTEACDDGHASVEQVVQEVARDLHRRRIPYRSSTLADCSGMMHRVLRTVAGRCEGVDRPSVRHARRAKDLARWYERADRLTRVDTATDIDAALTVGSVAFFLAPGKRRGGLDRVFHIGVVTELERDARGRIQSYAMFHGRRPGFAASITRWHVRDRRPALGNGTERMVAVAWPSDAVRPESWHTTELEDGVLVADDAEGMADGGAL